MLLSGDNGMDILDSDDISLIDNDDAIFRGASYVFHFAGIADIVPSIERPIEYISTNVLGTVRVLEAARFARVRKFVYAASSSCYGITAELPTTENVPISPRYPYALSKYQGEQAVLHWGQVYGLPVNSIRIFILTIQHNSPVIILLIEWLICAKLLALWKARFA